MMAKVWCVLAMALPVSFCWLGFDNDDIVVVALDIDPTELIRI